MLKFVFLYVTLAFILRPGLSANNNLREWKNACLAIISELEAHKSLTNDCDDNLGKLDEKLRQLNRKGYEQLGTLIDHQKKDGKIGAKLRQGYSLFERRFQRPLLKAMDYCRKLKRSTVADKASLGENFVNLIVELRADINTLVPQLEMALMEEQLMEAFENGKKFYQTEKLEELIDKITQMQTELDTNEGPSYLVNLSSSFERAKRELEQLREHNVNAEFVEMAKVLCIVSLLVLETRLDTVKNEFCAKIDATPSMNVSKLNGIRHQFFEEWHQIGAKIDSTEAICQHFGTDARQKLEDLLKMEHEKSSSARQQIMESIDIHFANASKTLENLREHIDQQKINQILHESRKCYAKLHHGLNELGITLPFLVARSATAFVPKTFSDQILAKDLKQFVMNEYINQIALNKCHSHARQIIEEAFKMPNKIPEEKIDKSPEEKINTHEDKTGEILSENQ